MKVFTDIISGDEMFSDAYPHELCYSDSMWEVKGKYVKKGNEFVAIAADDEADEGEGETVIDIVDAFNLNEVQFTKKDAMTVVKGFLKKTVAHLKKEGKDDRIKPFQTGATEFVKMMIGKHDEFQFFTGSSFDTEAHMAFAFQKEQEDAGPTFYYFADMLSSQKFWTVYDTILWLKINSPSASVVTLLARSLCGSTFLRNLVRCFIDNFSAFKSFIHTSLFFIYEFISLMIIHISRLSEKLIYLI